MDKELKQKRCPFTIATLMCPKVKSCLGHDCEKRRNAEMKFYEDIRLSRRS